jgi:chromosome segregation ATPase
VKYDFEYEDISKLPLEQAINDLCEIMINSEGKKNLIHLKLDEGHFQSYSFNNDEILEVLDSLNDEQKEKKDRIKSIIEKKKKKVTSKGKKKSLNKINEKLPSQNVEKGKRSINEKNNNAIELNLNINNENSNINCERQIVIQKEDDKQEQKEDDKQDEDDKQEEDNKLKEDDKQEQKENDKKKENDKQEQKEGDKQERQEDDKQKKQEDDVQSIMNEMKKIKNKLKNMEMSISNNEQKIKSLEESNQKLEESNQKLEESNQKLEESNQKLEKSNKKLEKSNQKLKKNIEQLKLDSTNFSNKVDKLESQLDTIKMRDGIKAFIDYIFASLKLAAKIGYESKIYMIYSTLNKKSKDYNQHLIKNIKFILYTVFKKLNIGNEFAHNVDLNSSIVDQMFELIKDNDNEEKLKETKIEFQKTNMDRVIKKLIQ